MKKVEKGIPEWNAGDIDEAIEMGIQLEKESILFYLELKEDGEFGEEAKATLQEIIQEERSYWRKLLALKQDMKN